MSKVLIFVVAYQAERFVGNVLRRIPPAVWRSPDYALEILVIDDASTDDTFGSAERTASLLREAHGCPVTVLYNPRNLGYGGNQKVGYHYAIERGFDFVILLHGDGQYAPELMPDMLAPLLAGEADAVFGSRMIHKRGALEGGMPLYKWIGNQILTALQNRIMGARLSEFHSGYRAYRVALLAKLPFELDSDYFDFDTDIIIQILLAAGRIREVPIPTYYGDEICSVNGVSYAARILWACVKSQLQGLGLLYERKFDLQHENEYYTPKFGFPSSHQFAVDHVEPSSRVLDLGCGSGFMAKELARVRGARTTSVDRFIQAEARQHSADCIEADIDRLDFDALRHCAPDAILALDIVEHLRRPEQFLLDLRSAYSSLRPTLLVTTGNVGFLPVRAMLLLGQFNYGKRGILDQDHTRLFTFKSLRKALVSTGYEVLEEVGIPAPFPVGVGPTWLAGALLWLNRLLIRLSRGLFAYQIAVVARPKPTLAGLLESATVAGETKIADLAR